MVVIQQRVVIESCLLTARVSLYLCDACYAELNELWSVWGSKTKTKQNKTFTYCPPSFGVDPACFNALAMSDFWARMPPFRDSNSSRRSDCSVASARNACSWVMFVFHSSRWSSVRSSVVLSSVVDSVLPSVVGRLAVGRCRWSLPLVVLSSVVRSVVGCRPLVVVVVRQSLVVGCLVGRPSSVVRFPSRSFGFRTVEGLSPQQPSTTVVPSVFFRLQGYSLSASFPPLGFS